MNVELLKRVGNQQQLCGIRETRLIHGPGQGVALAEFHNAAGLRFSLVPDRCMDIYDLSWKGTNLSFLTCNGLQSPLRFSALNGEFAQQWVGGMMYTCGLDNVGGYCEDGLNYPIHGRISHIPASSFGAETKWEGNDCVLCARGVMEQNTLFGARLSLERNVRITLYSKQVIIRDRITNCDAAEAPFMLLYHCNFGYPLLDAGSRVLMSSAHVEPLNEDSMDPSHITPPEDGRGEELYLCHAHTDRCIAMLHNPALNLAAYVSFDTAQLPRCLEWKRMKSHDYVLGLEPCNTWGIPRTQAIQEGKIATLPAYSEIETDLIIGVLDGKEEIQTFIRDNALRESAL